MDLTTVIDCTGANLGTFQVLTGQLLAGYVTGMGGVPWTPTQWQRYPTAVRIDQSPVNTPADETADVYDLEANAGTIAGLPSWVHQAWTSYRTNQRPGQRTPTLYCASSNVTPAVNALLAAGITNGVNLWVAESMTPDAAESELTAAGGPFPIIGIQYSFQALFDVSLVSTAWLNNVSGKPAVTPPSPGIQAGWRWCRKCGVMFFPNKTVANVCAGGGQHDGSQSHDYAMGYAQ